MGEKIKEKKKELCEKIKEKKKEMCEDQVSRTREGSLRAIGPSFGAVYENVTKVSIPSKRDYPVLCSFLLLQVSHASSDEEPRQWRSHNNEEAM